MLVNEKSYKIYLEKLGKVDLAVYDAFVFVFRSVKKLDVFGQIIFAG